MTTNEVGITRGHELYLRHLLLLGQAAPVCLKVIIVREVSKRHRGNLAHLIVKNKDTFKDHYKAHFLQLFQDDEVSTNIDLWDTQLLCDVTLVLFKPFLTTKELEAIACVSDQRKDLDKYARSASLSYNAFETKWDTLHTAMLTLIENIDDEATFKCKRMIHSFKSEPITVNIELINKMKQTNDANQHVQMAIQDKIVPKIHGEREDSCGEIERTDHQYDSPEFTENLQDTFIYVDESAIFTCKLNVFDKAVIWQHDSKPVEKSDNLMVVNKNEKHWLAISRAKLTDSGRYSCICGNTSTDALLKVTEKPLKIVESLHVATIEANVRVNEDIVLSCLVDRHTNEPAWRHNDKTIEPCDRRHISVQKLEHKLTIRNATFEDEGDYTVDFGDATSSTTLTMKENPVFREKLQNTFVYVDDPTILTCKLNVISEKTVTWRHDNKPVDQTDTLKLLTDKYTHWLAISHAKLTYVGHYSCVCGSSSTTAFLKVTEKPLKITKGLHVATAEADVRENMNIVLTCEVNRHTNEAVWRHDRQVIKQSTRHVISVKELQHQLTIRNAKFEDEGEYTIDFGSDTSSEILTIKGNLNMSHKKQLTEELYRNWIRGVLGLKYLKVGLERFSDTAVGQHHSEILAHVTTTVNSCTSCTTELLLPTHPQKTCPNKSKCLCSKQPRNRRHCPNGGFCSTFHDQILYDHRFNDPLLKNTDIQKWSSDPWSVATCYISTTGYQCKKSAKEVDCSGLLSLFINNTFFHRSLGDVEINGVTDLFKQTKDARNEILHSANYELAEGQLHDYIALFIKTLEIRDVNGKAPLSGQPGVQMAIHKLDELRNHQIEVHVSKDLQKLIKDLQEHAMNEVADNVQEAMKQSTIKVQQLEEKLKKTEEHLQLLCDLRSTPSKSKVSIGTKVALAQELSSQESKSKVNEYTEETSGLTEDPDTLSKRLKLQSPLRNVSNNISAITPIKRKKSNACV